MHPISEPDIRARIARDNYWWAGQDVKEAALPRRVYFSHFKSLALNFAVRRATVLMGPRRVGKTVMVKQVIAQAISEGIDRRSILYAAIDAPIYSGTSLEQFVSLLPDDAPERQKLIVFDEIQYLKNWELHLKDLVDTYPDIKFVATGSAAAALRLKSRESGAGRFTEFMLPPLTFYEFLRFIEKDDELITIDQDGKGFSTNNIHEFNKQFVDYLNFGGYPEAVLNPEIRRNPDQFIRNDIIEKVL
jgi:predicted AAA+ superfamily ATPase